MKTTAIVKKYFFVLAAIVLMKAPLVSATEFLGVQILDVDKLKQATYISEEFNGYIPVWIMNSELKSASAVKEAILENVNQTACTIHVFNLGSTEPVKKEDLVGQLLLKDKVLTLWKSINGKPYFEDLASGYALTFVCIGLDSERNEIIELDVADFENHFKNLLVLWRG